jgi:hypothetical protein
MHHFVQLSLSNGDLPSETGALPSASQSLLDLTMDLPHLGNPFPSQTVLTSCCLFSFSSTTLSASVSSKSMTGINSNQWEVAPQSIVCWAPPCLSNPLSHPQTESQPDLSFCNLFQNNKKSHSLKLLLKLFLFLLKNRRPLPLWTETNPQKRNIPP